MHAAQVEEDLRTVGPSANLPKRAEKQGVLIAPGVHRVELDNSDEEHYAGDWDKEAISL